jgi:lipopolysaccharide assembly protein A
MPRLIRLLSLFITLPVTLVVVVFAVANRHPVSVDFWPFALAMDIPLYALALGTLAFGGLLGALLTWVPLLLARHALAGARAKIETLETEKAAQKVLP